MTLELSLFCSWSGSCINVSDNFINVPLANINEKNPQSLQTVYGIKEMPEKLNTYHFDERNFFCLYTLGNFPNLYNNMRMSMSLFHKLLQNGSTNSNQTSYMG